MKKSGIMLCFAVFILVIGTGIVAPLLAPYAENLGLSGFWIGLLFSGFYIVRLVTGTPIGIIADKKGPRFLIVISLLLYPFIAILYWLADSSEILLAARLLHGLASAMMLPMAMSYIGNITPVGQEGKYMGVYNTFLFIAGGIGPLAGGVLGEQIGISNAFLSLFILAILSLVLVLLLPNVDLDEHSIAMKLNKEKQSKKILSLWKHPGLLSLAAINLIFAMLDIFLISFFTIYARSEGLSLVAVGFLIALNSIVIGITQVPLGNFADKHNKFRLILFSGLFTFVILLIFPLIGTTLWIIAALLILLGVTSALTLASSSALSTQIGRKIGMGGTMGYLGSASSLGMIIGPIVSGLIYESFDIDFTFYFSSAVWLVGILFFIAFWVFYRRVEIH
ncbi:MFS transporter [Aureibacillus halotolerans]|uniref:Putative MFS family arabinose efflux permease n=1 Tax=Aureibacillus halotolerans TaxID=1508390 RepID=A0A4R6TUH8_9BACI|nr:MFS transporter [Aureibacillus halotolerans]TDQ36252.1 putative MFS family arabinose efflux permease [Aureibacillus halotolerans]